MAGFSKKVEALAKQKECETVRPWIKSISNHLYFCSSSTPDGNGDIMVAKWKSIPNHVTNIHEHDDKAFPKCLHDPITSQEQKRKWLKPSK
jgi:hypothetical protein